MEPHRVDVLLLGGGVASARCARALRRHGFAGTITLVSDEAQPPYNRPPLSKELLRADLPDELVLAEPLTWYERRDVKLALGVPAVALDPGEHLVEMADGERIRYGQLLLATGAEPRRLAIPGSDRVHLLRTLEDAKALRTAGVDGRRAVVIGGGFIGVEVASSLAARGMTVTLVELAGELWAGSLGPRLSHWAVARLATVGVTARLGVTSESVAADGVGIADGLLPAELVVAGIGVLPRVDLARAAGLEVDDGMLVDDAQRTSDPNVFAAGDIARLRDALRIEHWHAARESGERAALGMLGQSLPPRRTPWVFSEVAGTSLDVVGSAPGWDEIIVRDGVHAYVADGTINQLAIVASAIPVDEARAFVERRPQVGLFRDFVADHR